MGKIEEGEKDLKAIADEGVWFQKAGRSDRLVVSTDTGWAGCKRTRKSTNCIVLQCGGCTLYTQVTGQTIHRQSSGEAEFYGNVSGISSGLGLQYLLDFIGMPVILELQSDSSAARGVLWRTGVGKIRHLEVKTLWVQDLVKAHKLLVRPVKGEENVADIGTKVHSAPRLLYLRGLLGLKKIDELQCFGGRVAAVGSFAGRVKRLLASVLACAPCAAGRQVANYDEKVYQVTTDINNNYERNTFWAYMMIAVIFILGMAVGAITLKLWQCRSSEVNIKKVVKVERVKNKQHRATEDKASQAPVTFLRNRAQPRFFPLPEYSHG